MELKNGEQSSQGKSIKMHWNTENGDPRPDIEQLIRDVRYQIEGIQAARTL